MEQKNQSPLAIPLAIVAAGLLVAIAIFFSGSKQPAAAPSGQEEEVSQEKLDKMRPVDVKADHIQGNPNAPVKIVVYTDLECPFCKRFHIDALAQVKENFVKSGKAAIVYRHFPLAQLHSRAPKEAEAAECVYEQGGNEKFFAFVDEVFATSPMNNGLDPAKLPEIAKKVGVDEKVFSACLSSGKFASKVTTDLNNAFETGGNGTPWSIVVNAKGDKIPVNGAQDYEYVSAVIEALSK